MALELNAAQAGQLAALQQQNYRDQVAKDILAMYPEENRPTLSAELREAHAHAKELGFVDGGAITSFLWASVFWPKFYREPMADMWLRKPGATVEQRFKDFRAVMKHEFKLQEEAALEADKRDSGAVR